MDDITISKDGDFINMLVVSMVEFLSTLSTVVTSLSEFPLLPRFLDRFGLTASITGISVCWWGVAAFLFVVTILLFFRFLFGFRFVIILFFCWSWGIGLEMQKMRDRQHI